MLNFYFYSLLKLKRPYKRAIQILTDVVLISLAFFISIYARLENFSFTTPLHTPDENISLYIFYINPYFDVDLNVLIQLFTIVTISIFLFFVLGIYRSIVRYISGDLLKLILVGTAISSLSLYLSFVAFGKSMAGMVPFIFFILLSIFIGGSRFLFRFFYFSTFLDKRKRVAIYGAGEAGRRLFYILNLSKQYVPVVFIDDDKKLSGMKISNLTIRSFDDLKNMYKKLKIDSIFLALPSVSRDIKKNILAQLENYPAEVKIIPEMDEIIEKTATIEDIRSITIEE